MGDSVQRTARELVRRRDDLQQHYFLLRGTLTELRRQRGQLQAQIRSVDLSQNGRDGAEDSRRDVRPGSHDWRES